MNPVDDPALFSGVNLDRSPRERNLDGCGLALIVGDAPSPSGTRRSSVRLPSGRYGPTWVTDPALLGETGRRLALWSGLAWPGGYARFYDRVNVLDRPWWTAAGEPWPAAEATARGQEIVNRVMDPKRWSSEPPWNRWVVVLGRRAWAALGLEPSLFFSVNVVVRGDGSANGNDDGPRFVLMPHPSRSSRVWNVPECEETAIQFLRALVSWGEYRGRPVTQKTRRH
jgi:uracil-DNA glycosylase